MKQRWNDFWYVAKTSAVLFWPQYWFRRAFMCSTGKHKWWVFHITNGETSVWCPWCKAKREPTEDERRRHPNYGFTVEQQQTTDEKVDKMQRRLDEYITKYGLP